jgi:hypothetical protein
MDAATVFRVISMIPDRSLRAQSGSAFVAGGHSDRVALLLKFLHWLGPLDPLSKEDQQLLGVRSGGGRPLAAGEEAGEEADLEELEPLAEDLEETPVKLPGAGTQIAA